MAQSTNYYNLYIESVLQLAETIVIKSEETAEGLNTWVSTFGGGSVDSTDPRSWKYYRNISGQYHPTDTPMTVVSLDTLEEIVFSKDTLLTHRATKRGYVYGTREYRQLVQRYPSQEMLILGILYPVNIDSAIAAPNLQILGYPPTLVEENEYSLVARLQQWINAYKDRWCNNQYGVSDDLYPAVALGVLYAQLVPAILNLRLQACKTNEAHSYHVREYLASHGLLNFYLDNLTLRQALFFYRNIAYIERNAGQRNIFEWLVEHIMTERHLPLAEYVMTHDLSKQPAEVYPTLAFQRRPLNPPQSTVSQSVLGLNELLLKEDTLAVGNVEERQVQETAIAQAFENSPANTVLTKTLESSMIDYSNATPYPLEEVLLNHWLWLSSNGYYYQAVVSVANPKTGERIPMVVKDAFIFMWYAYCSSIGIQLETIPAFFAKRVMRLPTPSVDQMLSVATLVPRSFAQQAHDWQPILQPMISTEAFYDAAFEIYQAANWQRKLVATVEHQVRRGEALNVVEQLYSDNICRLAPEGYTYEQWFADRKLPITDFASDDLQAAYISITKDATGLSLHTSNSLRNLQKAMVNLLGQLSSYSVQFLTDINTVDIRVGDGAAVRVGDVKAHLSAHLQAEPMVVEPLSIRSLPHHEAGFDVGGVGARAQRQVKLSVRERLELTVGPRRPPGPNAVFRYRLESAPVYASARIQAGPSQGGVVPVMGVDTVYSLSALERDELRDVYRNWNTGAAASKDLQFVLGQTHLPGFDWTQLNLGGVLPVGPLDGFDWVVTPPATPPRNVTAPTLTGLAQPGQTLTLNPGVWSADGATLYTYQWLDNGSEIVGEISATYVVPDDGSTVGHAVTAVVTAQAAGLTTQVSTQAVTIALPVVPPHNSVLPSIQGIAAPGNTLTASLGSWSASSTMIFTLQWLANGVAVPGATNVSYVIPNSAAQVGVALSVTVTALASGVATPATSAVVVVVAN